jgi:hypothetical protein
VPLTCADWLAVLEPRLVEPLFYSGVVARLHRLARTLPGECQGTLEVRLVPGATVVDLSLRLLTACQARGMAEQLSASSIGAFLCRWFEPEGPLAPVRSVWLEFDLDRAPEGKAPVPVVCSKLPGNADSDWLSNVLLPALQGRSLPASQRALILGCLGALPVSASLLYVFSLQARGSDAIRLEIFGLQPDQMLDYLRSVAPRTVSAVTEIAPLFAGVERLHLSLDVAEEVLPRIGIEGSFPRQPPRETRWSALFARLEERGLCSPAKQEAALAWPGYDTFWTAAEHWPVHELGPHGICVRTLSHVKVVCHPDGEPEAKAYLMFGPPDDSSDGVPASSPAKRSAFST